MNPIHITLPPVRRAGDDGPSPVRWVSRVASRLLVSVPSLLLGVMIGTSRAEACVTNADCDDGNSCTADTCFNLACGHTPVLDGTSCNDISLCNGIESCLSGACSPGAPLDCDDGNPCTDDICGPAEGCLHANNNLPCSDSNSCTSNDACNGGVCVGGNRAAGCTSCQAVAIVPAEGGTFVGTTTGTSSLSGSCGSSGSSPERVYQWTPATSGAATVQTCGSGTDYDSVIYVESGACTNGTELACNDDACTNSTGSNYASRLTVNVTAGQTYFIVVDGYGGNGGTYALTITMSGVASVCGNNQREGGEPCDGTDSGACPSRQCTASCLCVPIGGLPDLVPQVSDVGIVRNTTVSGGDVAEGCAESTSGVDLLRFTTTVHNNGNAALFLGSSGCPTPCDTHPLEICANPNFVCSPAEGHNHAHYDNYARYELLDSSSQAVVVGHKQGFCLMDTECAHPQYSCSNQGISAGCADAYYSYLGCQYLDITGIPPGNYALRVTVDPFERIWELNDLNNGISQPVTIPGQTGSACNNPTPIPASGGTFTGITTGSSTLSGSCANSAGAPEKVYQWIPSASGQATIETCGTGTGYDTVLYLRSGSCATGAQAACNDDACANRTGSGLASRITPTVAAGQTYFIVVDGYGSASGDFTLRVTPPAGSGPPDPCSSATVIPAQGGTVTGTTSGASVHSGSCGSTSGSPESAFQWTPAVSGTATVQTCGSGTAYDTVVYMRTGSCAGGTEVGCNNDACASATSPTAASRLTPTVTAGQTYYILVDGNGGGAGSFSLTVTPPAGTPPAGTCASPIVIPAAGGVVTDSTSGSSAVAGPCGNSGTSPEKVFTWTPAASGSATIRTCGAGTGYDTVLYVRQGSCSGPQRGCNDDACTISTGANYASSVSLNVNAGTAYTIVVDGYGGASGNFTLTVIPPP